jgi:hypothetical protein
MLKGFWFWILLIISTVMLLTVLDEIFSKESSRSGKIFASALLPCILGFLYRGFMLW